MAIKFPSLIEWIDEYGLKELHAMHQDFMKDVEQEISFENFVQQHYESCKEQWIDDMRLIPAKIKYELNNEGDDISLEMAKLVLKEMVNNSINNGEVSRIVLSEDMAPEYNSSVSIINDFFDKVIPAIEKALEELK
jgi:hypothetical protein